MRKGDGQIDKPRERGGGDIERERAHTNSLKKQFTVKKKPLTPITKTARRPFTTQRQYEL